MEDDLSFFEIPEEQLKARLEAIQKIQSEMGWRWFIAEIHNEITLIDHQLRYCTPEDLGRLQGRRDAFDQILQFEDKVDALLNPEVEDEFDAPV